MSLENVDLFLAAVKADPELQRELAEPATGERIGDRAARLATARGVPFTGEEYEARLREPSPALELRERDLEGASGGLGDLTIPKETDTSSPKLC